MSNQKVCPCIECENFTKSKFKCSATCKPLEEFNEYLSSNKTPNTDSMFNSHTENSVCLRSCKSIYFY
jgi:hypothetical protein